MTTIAGSIVVAPPAVPQGDASAASEAAQLQRKELDSLSVRSTGSGHSSVYRDAVVTNLLYACSKGEIDEVRRLIEEENVDVNARDYDKRTAAHIAAGDGHVEILKLLHQKGALMAAKDRWGGTPLDDALTENKAACSVFLESVGVKSGRRAAKLEAVSSYSAVPSERDPSSVLSQLLQATFQGNLEKMKKIDIDINTADYDARTALHVACSEGHFEVVQYLVNDRNAMVNYRDRWGHTPLDDAIRGHFNDVIDFLRERGGETTGVYDGDGTLKSVTEAEMRRLQQRGINEKWAIAHEEIKAEEKPFARGAGGELFRARWRGLKVVVKSCANMVSNRQALLDLGNEIALLSTLRHPNLIMFLGASFAVFPPVLLMEYAVGGTLEERIIRAAYDGHPLPRRERVKFTYELALALNFLHLCQPMVVHRDLKPSNILLTADLNVRVTDFGLSKFIQSKNRKLGDVFTMTGETGSYRFMAPEVFKHEQYNEKVDVYSFALIVYWMQTGVKPFVQLSDPVAAVRSASLDGLRPNFGASFDKNLRRLLEDSWNQNPNDRPPFSVILERLEAIGYDSFSIHEGARKCSLF